MLWGEFFPINKPIWTSSYVLYSGGIAMMVLALLFMIVDIWNLRGWTGFFNTFGTNALFTYVLAGMLTKTLLAIKVGEDTLFTTGYSPMSAAPLFEEQKLASLLFPIMLVTVVWALGYILYRKKIIIRL
ncbi:MAG: hypothetical protein U5L72_18490 [Bacteroidales bacterium]|nr:hypothetical protein [Bacteroidales bacterium]